MSELPDFFKPCSLEIEIEMMKTCQDLLFIIRAMAKVWMADRRTKNHIQAGMPMIIGWTEPQFQKSIDRANIPAIM